jgi:hypothetical protein
VTARPGHEPYVRDAFVVGRAFADLLSLLPFAVRCAVLYLVAREVLLAPKKEA